MHLSVLLSGPSSGQVSPFHELVIVDHPERPKVVLISHEAFVQGQVSPYCVLQVGMMTFANSDSVRQLKIEEITKAKTQKFGKINGKFRAIDFRVEKEKEELWFSIDRN